MIASPFIICFRPIVVRNRSKINKSSKEESYKTEGDPEDYDIDDVLENLGEVCTHIKIEMLYIIRKENIIYLKSFLENCNQEQEKVNQKEK